MINKEVTVKAKEFEGYVINNFKFLKDKYGMKKRKLRLINKNDNRDLAFSIRYESNDLRLDIGWNIYENNIGIIVKNLKYFDVCKGSFYFEPFIEYITQGKGITIVPQIYPGMSISKILRVIDKRNELFSNSIEEILISLAVKLNNNIPYLLSCDENSFQNFQSWYMKHQ